MDKNDLYVKFKEFLAEYTSENVTPSSNLFMDLGIDSFGLISFACELENEFNIKIPDKELLNFHTIQDVIEYINKI